jgi:hypothetical protein
VVSCATEVEVLPGVFGHGLDLCHKGEAPVTLTCVDGHGCPGRLRLNASDLLAGHGGGVAIELEALQVRARSCLRSGWHRTRGAWGGGGRIGRNGVAAGRMIVACSRGDGAAANYDSAGVTEALQRLRPGTIPGSG